MASKHKTEHPERRTKKQKAEEKANPNVTLTSITPVPQSPYPSGHKSKPTVKVVPGSFDAVQHFYPRVLNAEIHPIVRSFMRLGNQRIAQRYCHLHPSVDKEALLRWLAYEPQHFRWAGSDLFTVADKNGRRQMIVIETNSCPSGQKSMPFGDKDDEDDLGYRGLLEGAFVPFVKKADRKGLLPRGGLAVLFDKNLMENSGYAATMATMMNEPVYLVECFDGDKDANYKFKKGILYVKYEEEWKPIRAAFKYVTQKPWNRIPVLTKTYIVNPIIACLAGGRNKMVAAKAYDMFNAELAASNCGLTIRTPETIKDVKRAEIPLWVKSFGGHAVVKVPYSNAGQGVYTITNDQELQSFMESSEMYDKYIIQALVGNSSWSSSTRKGQFFHVGTVPDKKNQTYVSDVRMMVVHSEDGYRPLVTYARRAHKPLAETITDSADSWSMLGTNLSVKNASGDWETQTDRLLLMDRRDFNKQGIGIDDLIDAYVQTVLSTVAIDRVCGRLIKTDGSLDVELFKSLNEDPALMAEVSMGMAAGVPVASASKGSSSSSAK